MNRLEVLEEAIKCVSDREQQYSTPEDNFGMIAELWSVWLGYAVDARDVAMMMALLKVARINTGNSEDSFVDLAGYAACAAELAEEVFE